METLLANLLNIKLTPGLGIVFAAIIVPILMFCKSLPGKIYSQIKNMLTVNLSIDETDNMAGTKTFHSLNTWLCKNRITWLTRLFEVDRNLKVVAGTGFNVFFYKNKLFWCYMSRREPTSNYSKFKSIGTYDVYTFKWNKYLLDDFIQDSCVPLSTEFQGKLYKYSSDHLEHTSDFAPYMKEQKQLISNVTYENIKNILNKFLNTSFYLDNKLPHKETILLYGPPGTGKTNLVIHLAAKYNMDLVTISPDQVSDTCFLRSSWEAKKYNSPTIYLVEDIDSNPAFHANFKADEKTQTISINTDSETSIVSRGTLSDLLNALDGVNQLNNCIVILTTNNPQKLSDQIYRDGRVDSHILMDYITIIDTLDYLGWNQDSKLALTLYNRKVKKLPAAIVSKLRFAKTEQDVNTLLDGGDITKSLKFYNYHNDN